MDMNLSKLLEIVENIGAWWSLTHGVAKVGTENILYNFPKPLFYLSCVYSHIFFLCYDHTWVGLSDREKEVINYPLFQNGHLGSEYFMSITDLILGKLTIY